MKKKDNVTITLHVQTLQYTNEVSGELYLAWSRNGKGTETEKFQATPAKSIEYNKSFPIECNFKRKNNSWAEKILKLDLFFAGNRVTKWSINLADLYSTDIINRDLQADTPELGKITLSLILFLGPPDKLVIPKKTFALRDPSSKSALSPSFPQEELQTSTDITELRKSVTMTESPISPTARRRQSVRQKVSSVNLSPQKPPIELLVKIDSIFKEMNENGPTYTNGMPQFGVQIVNLFTEQSRGTNFYDPLCHLYEKISEFSQQNTTNTINSLLYLTFIYSGMKSNGLSVIIDDFSLEDKVHDLFKVAVNKLIEELKDELITNETENVKAKLKDYFGSSKGDEYMNLLVGLILYSVCLALPIKCSNEWMQILELQVLPFFDQSLLQRDGEVNDENIDIFAKSLDYIEKLPFPDF